MSVATYFAVVNKVNWLSTSTVLYFAAVFDQSTQEFFPSRITTFKVRTDKFSIRLIDLLGLSCKAHSLFNETKSTIIFEIIVKKFNDCLAYSFHLVSSFILRIFVSVAHC